MRGLGHPEARQTVGMDPVEIGFQYWLRPLLPEQMPTIASELLAAGYDTPRLREAAGIPESDPRTARDAFVAALVQLNAWCKDRGTAQVRRLRRLAQEFTGGERSIPEVASIVSTFVEVDEVLYDVLPEVENRFALLCLAHDSDIYANLGGDASFREVATALDRVADLTQT